MTDRSGTFIGKYQILEKLGEGGMAVVWKAYDPELDRLVALKVIRASFPGERLLKRFEREAHALSQLSHPNIIKIYDYGQDEGKPFFVMEFVPDGKTLRHRMGKPLDWQDAARLLWPIANAIAYAHEKKIIHRDLKPSNILIASDGSLKLADFGVVKFMSVESTSELTGTGAAVGTADYMAPEQMLGQKVDQRADIYALGCMFFEMVTGKRPYHSTTATETMLKKLDEAVPRVSDFRPGLPEAVELLILSAMAKDPADRPQRTQIFVQALEEFAKGNQKIPPGLRRKIVTTQKPSLSLIRMISVGLLILLITVGTITLGNTKRANGWFQNWNNPSTHQITIQETTVIPTITAPIHIEKPIITGTIKPTSTLPASPTPEISMYELINEGNIGQLQLLNSFNVNQYASLKWTEGLGAYRQMNNSLDYFPKFSPDGRYAVVNDTPGRKIIDTFTLLTSLTEDQDDNIALTGFSSDGRYYASITRSANSVVIWDTKTWSQLGSFTLDETVNAFTPPRFVHKDGKLWLVLSAGNSKTGEQFFWTFDVAKESLIKKSSITIDPYYSLYFPHQIGAQGGWGDLNYPSDGDYAFITNAKFEFGINAGTSPKLIWFDYITGSNNKQIEIPSRLTAIINVAQPFGGKPETVIPGRDYISPIQFSPDEKYAATGFRELLWVGDVSQCTGDFNGCGEPSLLLPTVTSRLRGNVIFSPSGEYVTLNGRVWRLKDGKAVFTIGQTAYWLDTGGWPSRNGNLVGLNTSTGIAFLNLQELVVSLEVEGNTISAGCWDCAFSADDQLFASKQSEILRVRKVNDGSVVYTFNGIPSISSLSFSPDGRFLIVINSVKENEYSIGFWGIPNGG